MSDNPTAAPFGSVFADYMALATMADGTYAYAGHAQPLENLSLHPATHVFHYGSGCFDGLKAHRQGSGRLAIFRLDDHVERLRRTVARLYMPVPDADMVRSMIIDAVEANASVTPASPGSLYIRPTLIGTVPNIGAAAVPSETGLLFVICSPVGDYFAGGVRPLTLYVETEIPRSTPQFGAVKSGANYVMALGPTLAARNEHGADQVLFAAGDDITETGAANFFLCDDNRVLTRALDESLLHGMTRDSIISLASDLGYGVEERRLSVAELKEWAGGGGEAFLTGTAAVVAPVGTLVIGEPLPVGDGLPGPNTLRLRDALTALQAGDSPDQHGWLTEVGG